MSRIFVDTWAWYALADIADADHVLAKLLNEQLLDQGHTFVTTNFVLSETVTLIRYHLHHQAAVQFWKTLHTLIGAELVRYVRVTEAHEDAAWAIFERYADQKFSYTDCTSFAVMRDLELQQVFTGDQHFATMGFILAA
ncbi:MAG: type II toxin-antitoxin system VapC family toxin [Anaerolineae bacterium]